MSWIYLFIAGLLEAIWASSLKFTDGFTRPGPSMLVGLTIAGSMVFLSLAIRHIPIGVGYAVWVSIGIVGAAISGAVLHGQSLRPLQALFIGLLLVAIVGLKLTSTAR